MTDRGSNDDLRGPGMLQGRYDNISRNNYDGKLTRSATRNSSSSSSSLTNRITRRTPVASCASSSYGVIMVIAVALRTSVLLLVTAVLATAASDTEFTPFTPLTSTNKDGQKLVSVPLIPHHVQKARRGLSSGQTSSSMLDEAPRRRQEAQQVGALYHGYGTHYVDLYCGTPPQRQTVIVDTGSGVTAFPCSGCKDCGYPNYHIDRYFAESESSTFEKLGCSECSSRGQCKGNNECRIGMRYQEGSSWSAYEARDKCYIGGYHNVALIEDDGGTDGLDPGHAPALSFPMVFGCQDSITGLFKTQLADGIMGMENDSSAFWYQMYSQHKINTKGFSLCFSRPEEVSKEGTEAGALTLGGTDTRLHTSPMVYSSTKGTSSRGGFFSVHVRNIFMRGGSGGTSAISADPNAEVIVLDGTEDSFNIGGVIVDSGTTDTYWNSRIKTTLRENFKKLSGQEFGHGKLTLTNEELLKFPTILFQLSGDEEMNKKVAEEYGGGDPNKISGLAGDLDADHPYDVILAVPPTHYMEPEDGVYVNRVYDTEASGSVLGANSMMNHDILFDADNERIGWAESNCDYRKLVNDGGYADALDGPTNNSPTGKQTVPPKTEPPTDSPPPPPKEDKNLPPDEKKKDEPITGSDTHDKSSPSDDIQQSLADQCSGLICRGGVVTTLILSCLVCYFLYGCCCKRSDKSTSTAMYQRPPELEMTNGNGRSSFSSYKDDSFDDEHEDEDDGEYGGGGAFDDAYKKTNTSKSELV